MFLIVGNFTGRVILYYSHRSNYSKGVPVLNARTLQFELKSARKDSNDRFVIVKTLVQDSSVVLFYICAPKKTYKAIDFYGSVGTTLLASGNDQDYISLSWVVILMCR